MLLANLQQLLLLLLSTLNLLLLLLWTSQCNLLPLNALRRRRTLINRNLTNDFLLSGWAFRSGLQIGHDLLDLLLLSRLLLLLLLRGTIWPLKHNLDVLLGLLAGLLLLGRGLNDLLDDLTLLLLLLRLTLLLHLQLLVLLHHLLLLTSLLLLLLLLHHLQLLLFLLLQ